MGGCDKVLLADAEGLCDPTEFADHLLLGRHGLSNEAQRHVLEQRRAQGPLNKARRGAWFDAPPIG